MIRIKMKRTKMRRKERIRIERIEKIGVRVAVALEEREVEKTMKKKTIVRFLFGLQEGQ